MTAAAMTYNSLVEDITTYAERANDTVFVAQIPRFIMMAENRIASEVRGLGLVKVASSTMEIGNPIIPKPARWRETVSFNLTTAGERRTVYERSYEYCRFYSPSEADRDVPAYYSDYGYEHFFVVKSPLAAYPFEILYYERPEPLSSNNQTNWTTQYAPQLILFAALLEAQPFLKNDGRIAIYQSMYDRAVGAVTTEAKRRAFDRSAGIRE